MNRDQDPNNYEDRLLARLRAEVATREAVEPESSTAAPAWRRRAPRLALAGGAVTAVAAAVMIVNAGGDGTPAAYAVTPQGNGEVAVEIHRLSDPAGLERALDDAGVPAEVNVAEGQACEPSKWHSTDAETADAAEPVMKTVELDGEDAARFTVSPKQVEGKTLVLTVSRDGDEMSIAQATVDPGEGSAAAALVPCEGAQAPTETLPAEPAQGADAESAPTTR